jgi:hypothetical protein
MDTQLKRLSSAPWHRALVPMSPKLQRQLIAAGRITSVKQIDAYGRWIYTTDVGDMFISTINPARNDIVPGAIY